MKVIQTLPYNGNEILVKNNIKIFEKLFSLAIIGGQICRVA